MVMDTVQHAGPSNSAADERVAEMRQLLMEIQAIDTASALRSLRRPFPPVPLAERVRALAGNANSS
jgi:hypothetical protein